MGTEEGWQDVWPLNYSPENGGNQFREIVQLPPPFGPPFLALLSLTHTLSLSFSLCPTLSHLPLSLYFVYDTEATQKNSSNCVCLV